MKTRKKLGLALSSGSSRGTFTLGVLKALQKAGIEIDFVSGSSVGSLGAIGVASGISANYAMDWALHTSPLQYMSPDLTDELGVVKCDKLMARVKELLGDNDFASLKIPAALVAMDLETSELAVFKEGSVLEGITASIGAPTIFPPLRKNGRYYVDAGLVDPVPIDVLRNMGAEVVIAVDQGPVTVQKLDILDPTVKPAPHFPGLCEINHMQSGWVLFNRWAGMLHRNAINQCIFEFKPEFVFSLEREMHRHGITQDVDFSDMSRTKELANLGEKATNAVIKSIKKTLYV